MKNFAYSDTIKRVLACPLCNGALNDSEHSFDCQVCGQRYPYSEYGSIDFRLQSTKQYTITFEVDNQPLPPSVSIANSLEFNMDAQKDILSAHHNFHLSPKLLKFVPEAKAPTDIALDLGCGDCIHQAVCEYAGFEYIGLDYFTPEAMILGDGHALPFKSNSVDFILSMAVLEHIRYPPVMMAEARRVLKPGGLFIGSVSFLEPFHGDSFYHHSHLGLANTLTQAGFRVEWIAPNEQWPGLVAQANMGLFPKLPVGLSKAVVAPTMALHRMWWRAGRLVRPQKLPEEERIRNNAGAFFFLASKQEDSGAE